MAYERGMIHSLMVRLKEAPTRVQILAGPRQVGKTTLVHQLLGQRPAASCTYVAADAPDQPIFSRADRQTTLVRRSGAGVWDHRWLLECWRDAEYESAQWQASEHPLAATMPYLLVIDEVQKVRGWSETVKGLWDQQLRSGAGPRIHLLLLGSAPLLMQKGLTESLAGRYEVLHMPHWSFEEMNDAFGCSIDQYLYFGAYPGSAALINDESRWRGYVIDGLVQPNIEKDILPRCCGNCSRSPAPIRARSWRWTRLWAS
jgi:uncharacterized protein